MSAYLVCIINVEDPETYKQYTAKTPAIIEHYGGRFLVRGGEVHALEGQPFRRRLVLVEFPDEKAARRFYDSADYQAVVGLRHTAAESTILLALGVPPGEGAPEANVKRSQ